MSHKFPKCISIQTTSLCNGHCVFCPYEEIKGLFPKKIMEINLFRRIMKECSKHSGVERIILYLNNEPLTDPYIVDRINYAKENVPSASVHILTNGSLLTEDLADKLINSKLDWIGFSLHGIREETIQKAMGLDYGLTFKRVLNFIEKAKERRKIEDFVMVTFLRHQYLDLREKEETIRFWQDKGIKRISYFDGPVSRAGNVRGLPKQKNKEVDGCSSIWANEMIHIVENGNVILCCMDWRREIILGNVSDKAVYDIWNSEEYRQARGKRDGEIASEDNFICKRCESSVVIKYDSAVIKHVKNEERLDILLITFPPWGIESPPIGLGYLDSYMESKGLRSRVYDFNIYFYNTTDDSYKMLWHVENKNFWSNEQTFPIICEIFKSQIDYAVNKILATDSDLIGFSVVDPKERLTIEVIRKIKDKAPHKKIILGGPACSTEEQRNFFIDNIPGYIDCFVVGEGEDTLCEIIQKGKAGLYNNIPGVAINENGRCIYQSRHPGPIDRIGFPTYRGFDLNQYKAGNKSLLVEWSRGCIGRCSFCKNHTLFSGYQSRSPESVLKELEYIIEHYGIKEFTVCDNLMNGDIKQLVGICDGLLEKNPGIKWSGQITPRKEMNYALLSKMRKAGCFKVQIGVESGSDKILRNMRKIYTTKVAQDNIRAAKEASLETEVFIMVGFPGETDKEFRKTCDFIKRNAKYINAIKSINTLHLIAGAQVYEHRDSYGIKPLPNRNWHYLWSTFDGNTYDERKRKTEILLDLSNFLGLRVIETNIIEGKEEGLLGHDFAEMSFAERIDRLKIKINRLHGLPEEQILRNVLRKHPLLKFVLLVFVFIFTLCYMIYFWLFRKIKGKFLLGGE